jgi:hypothetical protein
MLRAINSTHILAAMTVEAIKYFRRATAPFGDNLRRYDAAEFLGAVIDASDCFCHLRDVDC